MAGNASTIAFGLAYLRLLLENQAWTEISDGLPASTVDGNIYFSLHYAKGPTDAKMLTQESFELSYPSYSRVAVPRTTGYWTILNSLINNEPRVRASLRDVNMAGKLYGFGQNDSGVNLRADAIGIGTSATGPGQLIHWAPGLWGATWGIDAGYTPYMTDYTITLYDARVPTQGSL